MKPKKILYVGLVAFLTLSLGCLYREYMYAERLAKVYLETSLQFQSLEYKTQVLKGNIQSMINTDKITATDMAHTIQAAHSCYDAFSEAGECTSTYIQGQCLLFLWVNNQS